MKLPGPFSFGNVAGCLRSDDDNVQLARWAALRVDDLALAVVMRARKVAVELYEKMKTAELGSLYRLARRR